MSAFYQVEMDDNELQLTLKALKELREKSTDQEETNTATDLIDYIEQSLP